jgi:hypothetical protein
VRSYYFIMESTDVHAGMRPPIEAETIDETVPLLSGDHTVSPGVSASIKKRTFLITAAAIVIIDLAMWLGIAPQTQIMEDIICRQYYEHGPSDPSKLVLPITSYDCKIPAVQNELAFISGWYDTLFSLPSKYRKIVISINLYSCIYSHLPHSAVRSSFRPNLSSPGCNPGLCWHRHRRRLDQNHCSFSKCLSTTSDLGYSDLPSHRRWWRCGGFTSLCYSGRCIPGCRAVSYTDC